MKRFGRFFSGFLSLAVLALLLIGLLNLQNIEDWWKLRGYSPPAAVAKLAEEDTMTAKAKHYLYVNHPDLTTDISTFHQDCPTYEQTIVLGCYRSGESGIFIYNVQDPRLNGVIEVTAAHEMLHGAYERLSQKDKNQVDGWLTDYYQHDLHDQRIIEAMNSYKKTEPNDVVNEMHSVFGTEISSLPPQLESYYKRYFINRGAVTAFAAGYEDEFSSRVDKINSLEQQLSSLKLKISAEEVDLSNQRAKIEADRSRLDSLRASGQYDAYNAGVDSFNAEVDAYNAGVAQLKRDISEYNQLVEAHNALAAELRSLYSSLDTSLTTQSAQ